VVIRSLKPGLDVFPSRNHLVFLRPFWGYATRNGLKSDVVVSPKEQRDGVAANAAAIDSTVNCRFKNIVCPSCELVSEVDHKGSWDWRCVDPFFLRIENLQSLYS